MKRQRGFTLIEIIVAMALLATIMMLLYSGLTFALRSWDAGDANGRRVADQRLGENFMRRELMELFPMRWKNATQVKFAFEGEKDHLKFVSSRPAGLQQAGLSLVGLEAQQNSDTRARNLVMRRAMPDDEAVDFGPLDKAEPVLLIANVDTVSFAYFGAENDFTEPKWVDKWEFPAALPQLIRVRVKMMDGRVLPDAILRVTLGMEAGCLESSFQRFCRPRRPSV
jgi:general secretion pathway protein J